jgi:acyl-homoserine lactone acylase PvdQ
MNKIFDWCEDLLFAVITPIVLVVVLLASLIGLFYGVVWAVSPESEEHRVRRIAESTPHVYAEVDGCTVYTWYANSHNHYFTKCPTKVTTEGKHSERSGKITKQFTETIETER